MTTLCGIVRFDGEPVDSEAPARMAALGDGVKGRLVGERAALLLVAGGASAAEEPGSWLGADARLDDRSALAASLGFPEAAATRAGDAALLAQAASRRPREWPRMVRGAFAVARWDGRRRRLSLARDLAGERSLFWARSGRSVLFASEPIQLLASGLLGERLDRVRLLEFLLGAAGDPIRSAFAGISRLPEGHAVEITESGSELVRHSRWEDLAEAGLEERAAAELARRLSVAVRRRLGDRGRIGVLLSGGLDSSAVAAAAAREASEARRPVLAFTWTSAAGDAIDETPRSRRLVESLGLDERAIPADRRWPLSRFPDPLDPNDPETNAYPDLLWETLEAARREGVGVFCNGIGGDPVCGWTMPVLTRLGTGGLRELASGGLRGDARRLLVELRSGLRRRLPSWLSPEGRRTARRSGLARRAFGPSALRSPRAFRLHTLAHPRNARTLERFDRASRRVGLRLEAPWHDVDLAAWALSLGDAALDRRPPGKSLAREAFTELLPAPILAGPKLGPPSRLVAEGLLGHESDRVRRMLASPAFAALDLVDTQAVLELHSQSCRRGEPAPGLWELAALAAWVDGREMVRPGETLLNKIA